MSNRPHTQKQIPRRYREVLSDAEAATIIQLCARPRVSVHVAVGLLWKVFDEEAAIRLPIREAARITKEELYRRYPGTRSARSTSATRVEGHVHFIAKSTIPRSQKSPSKSGRPSLRQILRALRKIYPKPKAEQMLAEAKEASRLCDDDIRDIIVKMTGGILYRGKLERVTKNEIIEGEHAIERNQRRLPGCFEMGKNR